MYHLLDVLVAVTGNPPFLSSKVAKYCSAVLGFVISIVPELELLLVSQSAGATLVALTSMVWLPGASNV